MKKLLLCLLCAAATFLAQAQPPSDASLNTRMIAGHMPGASFSVVKEGKWVYSRSLGKMNIATGQAPDANTIYMMASVSKTMIATAAMQLWEKGRLDLDVNINRYLPFAVKNPIFNTDSITMRHLLTHTSTIEDDWNKLGPLYQYGDSPISLDSFLQRYLLPGGAYYTMSNYAVGKPGTNYSYSNVASTLAAYIVERIAGDKFSHYCDTAIFQKLCMTSSSFLLAGISDTTRIAHPYSYSGSTYTDEGFYGYPDYPDGQLRSSLLDMTRFMTAYMQYGQYEGRRILDSTTIVYMLQQQTPAKSTQGLIFYRVQSTNGDIIWGHNGGDVGVNTAMYFNLQKRVGAIALTNGNGTTPSNADKFVYTFYDYGINLGAGFSSFEFPACGTITGVNSAATVDANIQVYPNPSTGALHISMPYDGKLCVYDMQGRAVYHATLAKDDNTITLPASLATGTYILKLDDGKGSEPVYKRITLQQ